MFCLPSRHKAESAGRSCVGRCHNPYASINTFFRTWNTLTQRERRSPFVSRRTYRGNCGSAASGGILWRSPERPSHARTKGAVLYVTKPVKIRRIKEPESRQSHGAPTHPSPQSAETREADKVGHQLFILLWCTSTYQVWSRRYWFHLAEASTPPPARLYWNHCRPRKRRLRAITQIVPRDRPAACIFHEGSPVLG